MTLAPATMELKQPVTQCNNVSAYVLIVTVWQAIPQTLNDFPNCKRTEEATRQSIAHNALHYPQEPESANVMKRMCVHERVTVIDFVWLLVCGG